MTGGRGVGLDAGRVWQRAREGEVSVADAVAVGLARYWAGLALELPGEASWRVRLARGLFPEWMLAEGFCSPERHKHAAWVPPLVMTDRVRRAARFFAKNFARGAKRHVQKRVGRWVPEEWGD